MLSPSQVSAILSAHDAYWERQRPQMRQYHSAYMTRYWRDQGLASTRVEVAKAFQVVQSYLGALYARAPSVIVSPDLRASGNPEVAQGVANHWLLGKQPVIEAATVLALVFPHAALKLSPVEDADPLRRVAVSAIPPWELVLDRSAPEWSRQRWVGHVYQMPLAEAKTRYNRPAKDFAPKPFVKWIDQDTSRPDYGFVSPIAGMETEDDKEWVRVHEVYDMESDKLLVWSPDYANGDKYLFKGVRVQVDSAEEGEGGEPELTTYSTGIPWRTATDRPVVPIVPLYLGNDPTCPLDGYSLLARIWDQVREINIFRTYSARGVRRMARQWLVREGFFGDDNAPAQIAEGQDGTFISVQVPMGQDLTGNIIPLPNEPIPADISAYQALLENDIQQSGVNAPFVSGQVTGVTATENSLLAEYTASQLGRMVRTRDEMIAQLAKTYNLMLAVTLDDQGEPLNLPGLGPVIVTSTDLDPDYAYFAADAGSTPMADAAKRQQIMELAPMLVQLGADPAKVLTEIIRVNRLSDDLLPAAVAGSTGTEPTPPAEGTPTEVPNEVA